MQYIALLNWKFGTSKCWRLYVGFVKYLHAGGKWADAAIVRNLVNESEGKQLGDRTVILR